MKILRKTWGKQSAGMRSIVALTSELQTIRDPNIQISVSVLRNTKKKLPTEASGETKRNNLNDPKIHGDKSVEKDHPPPSPSSITSTTGITTTRNGSHTHQ